MTQTAHTPGPLEVFRGETDHFEPNNGHYTAPANFLSIFFGDESDSDNYAEVHGPNQEANAAFIVRACNSHYEMLGMLHEAKGFIEVVGDRNGMIAAIDAVIAKAEGRS